MINDILDFSKIEAGRLELDDHDFDLREAIEDTCEMLASAGPRQGRWSCSRGSTTTIPPLVSGDRGRLRQIVTNLLSNAVKFTEEGEVTVRVRLERRDGDGVTVRFEVADTGIGIEAEKLETIFESFSQADTSTTRRYGGTGLGLAISRQLAEMMGGELWRDLRARRGSTFHFTGCGSAARTAPARARRGAARVPEGLSVLVVDDNATNRQIVDGLPGAARRARASRPPPPATRSPSCTRPAARASRSSSSCSTTTCPAWTGSSSPGRSAAPRACARSGW